MGKCCAEYVWSLQQVMESCNCRRAAALAGGIAFAAWYIIYRRDTRTPPTHLNADLLNRDMGTTQQSRMPPPSKRD